MREVRDNATRHRFELEIDGHIAFADYRLEEDVVALIHTEVPAELGGKGVGSRLVAGALTEIRARGLKVRPACDFVRAYVERHPEWNDLIA